MLNFVIKTAIIKIFRLSILPDRGREKKLGHLSDFSNSAQRIEIVILLRLVIRIESEVV